MAWKKITKELPNRVLVTNNIKARDADGGMSHVWITFVVESDDPERFGKFTGFDEANRRLFDLTHYHEIPMP